MGRWVEDDVEMGDSHEIGDSPAGMQRYEMGAAQQQLAGALAALAQGRFGQHAPLSKRLPSQYRDGSQLGIEILATIALSSPSVASWQNPSISGATTVFTSFKPMRAVITEQLLVTFSTSALGAATVAVDVPNAGDLLLTSAFSGDKNVFPNAPSATTGISANSLQAQAYGVGISWPTVSSGVPVTAVFSVKPTVLFRAAPPAGYATVNITQIVVDVNVALYGPKLR